MTWVIAERPNSRKFNFTDDGSAKASVSLICTSATEGDIKGAPRSIWQDLATAGWNIGAAPGGFTDASVASQPFDNSVVGSTWRVESYQGAQPANANGDVWNVEISMSWVGSVGDFVLAAEANTRRDVDIMLGGLTRQASTYRDWFSSGLVIPNNGDADWGAVEPSDLLMTGGDAVDVNGRPIVQHIPGMRVTINVLEEIDIESASVTAKGHVGNRNNATVFGWAQGMVLLEGVEVVQVGHGYARTTARFYCDQFYHLQQEAYTSPADNASWFSEEKTILDAASDPVLEVWHTRSLWRQPYALTTSAGSWDLSDLYGTSVKDYIEGKI